MLQLQNHMRNLDLQSFNSFSLTLYDLLLEIPYNNPNPIPAPKYTLTLMLSLKVFVL